MLEVELKFATPDPEALAAAIESLGCGQFVETRQVDRYFAHPVRDFAQTDEALRLRSSAGRTWITYKGPKLDADTKTRRELELALAESSDSLARFTEILVALGFRPVAEVRKTRRTTDVDFAGQKIEIALDAVDEVGHYVEFEIQTGAEHAAAAKGAIQELARRLGLNGSERRSYLELLLESRKI